MKRIRQNYTIMLCYLFAIRTHTTAWLWWAILAFDVIPYLPQPLLRALRWWVFAEREHCRNRRAQLQDIVNRVFGANDGRQS